VTPRPASAAPRTQAERREATQSALLDATIDCLVESGWAGTTTRVVAERARVSQGAQQHYYPTKRDLVQAAIERLIEQLASAALAGVTPGGVERTQAGAFLDRLWQIHTMPLNCAVHELLGAARTDDTMTASVARIVTGATDLTRTVAAQLMPTLSRREGFDEWLLMSLAVMRGTVAVMVTGAESTYLAWPSLRDRLMRQLDELPVAAT
jgi:AcrR family transcriptional regulator